MVGILEYIFAAFLIIKWQTMNENFVKLFRPNLLRGNSLVLIGGKKHGKTVAYLPAICSLVEVSLNAIAHTMYRVSPL